MIALARVHATKRDLSPVGQMLQPSAQRAFEFVHLVTVYNSSRPADREIHCSAALSDEQHVLANLERFKQEFLKF